MKKTYTTNEKKVLMIIGYVFLKINKDVYNKTYEILNKLGIIDVTYTKHIFKKDNVEVTLHRPGLFIGKKGSIIYAIAKEISNELNKKVTVTVKEDDITNFLYLMDPRDFGYY